MTITDYFPEEYTLRARDGSSFQLKVNTDTDRWWFKVEFDGTAVGEASCIQRGEELKIQHFRIFEAVSRQGGVLTAAWRKLIGAPMYVSYQGRGLGSALLDFIRRRAVDFIATKIVINFGDANPRQDAGLKWFGNRGFTITTHNGHTSAFLVLVEETNASLRELSQPKRQASRSSSSRIVAKGQTSRLIVPREHRTDFLKDALSALFRPLSDFINRKNRDFGEVLDGDVHENLTASRVFVRHGGDTRVLQFHIWHRYQPTIFHPKHYKYEVQYDPYGTMAGSPTENFSISLHVNKTRVYHEREAVLERFRKDLKRLRIPGFKFNENHICIEFIYRFQARTHVALMRDVTKHLFPLLNAVHPIYSDIMDSFNADLTKEQRRAVIVGRKRTAVSGGSRNPRRRREFCREVPPQLRDQVFRRDKFTCQICGKTSSAAKLHADHRNPVALGGLTTLNNLQTLCGPCNLKKGKRVQE
jgi:hypothetical protein